MLAVYHPEIVKAAQRIQVVQYPDCRLFDPQDFFISHFHRIHMDHKENPKFFRCLPLNPVNNLVGLLDIHVIRHLCMDRCHAASRTIIMYDQIVSSFDPVIFLNEMFDFLIYFRVDRLPDQWLQRISRNTHAGPHNDKRDAHPHDSVDIDSCHCEEDQRQDRSRRSDHITHGISKYSHHHFRVDLLSQFPVEQAEPQLYGYGQDQDDDRNDLEIHCLRMQDLSERIFQKCKAHFKYKE